MKTKHSPVAPFLAVKPMPLGVVMKGQVIKFKAHRAIYFLSDSGQLYNARITGKTLVMIERASIERSLDAAEMQALKKLGQLSSQEVTAAKTREKASARRRLIADKKAELLSAAMTLGLPMAKVHALLASKSRP